MFRDDWLIDGPGEAPVTLVLAHGAGAPMDSPFMNVIAEGVARSGFRVVRFEFPYMARRRTEGVKGPPNREPVLLDAWREVFAAVRATGPTVIGGKSLGGRMASKIADEVGAAGLVCLGYPFHPPGKPERLRTEHLRDLQTPTLIVQGTRDPFGTESEVGAYQLSPEIRVFWSGDGDHGLKPRVRSGRTETQNLTEAIEEICGFMRELRV